MLAELEGVGKAILAGSPGLLPVIFLTIWPSIWPDPIDLEEDARLAANNPPRWAKVLFMLSNVPYLFLTLWLATLPPIYTHPWLPTPVQAVCRMSALYASVAALVTTSSLLMHGAQLQMLDGCSCCGSARRRPGRPEKPYDENDHPLHRRTWHIATGTLPACVFFFN